MRRFNHFAFILHECIYLFSHDFHLCCGAAKLLQYNLTLVASDTLHENYTFVRIHIKDINDLPPKFDETSYETTIHEEESEGLPKRILQV